MTKRVYFKLVMSKRRCAYLVLVDNMDDHDELAVLFAIERGTFQPLRVSRKALSLVLNKRERETEDYGNGIGSGDSCNLGIHKNFC